MKPLRTMMVRRVQAVFNDSANGEKPVMRSRRALYPTDSIIWRVHADVTTMMIGGVTALLIQMLHPAALAGVWDHSNFRHDMLGRLRRTARFIAETTYAEADIARATIAKVIAVHGHVRGTLPDGRPYSANDPDLLAWVHAAESWSFLEAWKRYGEPAMSAADQDRYFAEAAFVAHALGANPVPQSRSATAQLLEDFRPQLLVTSRTREVARMVLAQPAPLRIAAPAQAIVMRAAVDLLPDWAAHMHGLHMKRTERLAVQASAMAIYKTLHWAFADVRQRIAD